MSTPDQQAHIHAGDHCRQGSADQAIDVHDMRMLRFFLAAHVAGSVVLFAIACLVASTLASQPGRHADPTGPLEVSLRRPVPATIEWPAQPVPASMVRTEPASREVTDMPPPWATSADGRVTWRQE